MWWVVVDEPDRQMTQVVEARRMSVDDARQLASWGPTIERWNRDGDPCLVVTEHGPRSATLEDVADAIERLPRRPRRPRPPG
jgi:hypothetical protein